MALDHIKQQDSLKENLLHLFQFFQKLKKCLILRLNFNIPEQDKTNCCMGYGGANISCSQLISITDGFIPVISDISTLSKQCTENVLQYPINVSSIQNDVSSSSANTLTIIRVL